MTNGYPCAGIILDGLPVFFFFKPHQVRDRGLKPANDICSTEAGGKLHFVLWFFSVFVCTPFICLACSLTCHFLSLPSALLLCSGFPSFHLPIPTIFIFRFHGFCLVTLPPVSWANFPATYNAVPNSFFHFSNTFFLLLFFFSTFYAG